MAYPNFTSSSGLKTSTTVLAAATSGGNREVVIQNQDTAVLKIKLGAGATTSDYDFILKACTAAADGTSIPIALPAVPYDQVISCFSAGTPSYTMTYR